MGICAVHYSLQNHDIKLSTFVDNPILRVDFSFVKYALSNVQIEKNYIRESVTGRFLTKHT